MEMHVGMELPWSMGSGFVVRSTAEKFLERNMETHQTWGDPARARIGAQKLAQDTHIGKLGRGAGGVEIC